MAPTLRSLLSTSWSFSCEVYVYSCSPCKLLFTFNDLAELELADLAFSRCGSRLYALSRATSKRLTIFSMKTGQMLPGIALIM